MANFWRVLEFDKFAGEWPLLNMNTNFSNINFKPLKIHQQRTLVRVKSVLEITRGKLTAQADGTLFDILFFSVVVLLPLNLGELVREGVSLDAALRRAAIVLGHGPALLDDAQVVVVTTGTRGLK
jgi:hypothetical protein